METKKQNKTTKKEKIVSNDALKNDRVRCEIWSRSVGYLRPVEQWHSGKQAEFQDRKTFDKQLIGGK